MASRSFRARNMLLYGNQRQPHAAEKHDRQAHSPQHERAVSFEEELEQWHRESESALDQLRVALGEAGLDCGLDLPQRFPAP